MEVRSTLKEVGDSDRDFNRFMERYRILVAISLLFMKTWRASIIYVRFKAASSELYQIVIHYLDVRNGFKPSIFE
ncbi:hypothetical protein BVRB_1g013100 [Beta vulgaris subsp. vulgaris]|nr:hypothetical protein BVRB_1g013100 [Beta vulgaris subsp. vulgaris]